MNTYVTGSTIRQLREAKHLTQTELASLIGVSAPDAALCTTTATNTDCFKRKFNRLTVRLFSVMLGSQTEKEESSMEKYVPYEKLSKKEKRKASSAKRNTWGAFSPVTRKPQNSRAYNRRKAQDWKRELPPDPVSYFIA